MTFKYTSLNDKKRLVKEIVSGGVNGMLGKNQVALEYGGSLNEKGQSAQARTLQIVSDRNAKLPYHFDMLYKAVNLNRGSLQLIRKYNFDLSLAKATTVKYAYTSLPEGANNAIQAVKSQAFSLNQQISKDTKLAIGYTVAEDLAKRTDTSKLSALLSSQIDALTAVGVEYSVDLNTLNGQHSDMHTFRVSYDHRVDGDNYLGFSTLYSMDREGSATELRMDVDYKLRF
jgi:hypothetical protein